MFSKITPVVILLEFWYVGQSCLPHEKPQRREIRLWGCWPQIQIAALPSSVVWSWTTSLTSLILGFLIHGMKIVIPISKGCHENWNPLSGVPRHLRPSVSTAGPGPCQMEAQWRTKDLWTSYFWNLQLPRVSLEFLILFILPSLTSILSPFYSSSLVLMVGTPFTWNLEVSAPQILTVWRPSANLKLMRETQRGLDWKFKY